MKKPICIECEKENKKYSVTEPTTGMRTLMGIIPAYWDEDGNYHESVDPNHTTYQYQCGNGHTWNEVK